MFRSILVPLDGSSFGEQALPMAVSIARRSGAKLRLLLVHRLLDVYYAELQPMSDTLEDRLRQQETSYLENMARKVREAAAVDVTPVFSEGHVATAIRQEAASASADLVVMTTHARGVFGRFWLGSTTDEVVRELPMPVLLIHPGQDRPVDLGQDVTFQHMLVPLDGTPLAEQILAPASELGKLFGADLTFLRVLQPMLPTAVPTGMGTMSEVAVHMAEDIDRLQGHVEQEAFAYLEKTAKTLRDQGLTVKTHLALADQPGVGILREAEMVKADLIALETHGRRGLSRLLLGSVADKVLRGSPVPLLVHRPKA